MDDLISRQEVSDWLKQYGQDVLHKKYKFSLMYIWKNLMDLPSAQPERGTDLVSRSLLLAEYDRQHKGAPGGARKIIEEAPSAQPEIIRCKDCKWGHAEITPDGNEIYWICDNWDFATDADGFCHEAKRRTGWMI